MFWAVLFGLPLCLFSILFGIRLNRWEEEQLSYEEQQEERARLTGLWHRWANHCTDVAFATTFLSGIESIDGWTSRDAILPVNLGRSCGLEWLPVSQGKQRPSSIFELVSDRLSAHLASVRELDIVLLLDEQSLNESDTWKLAAQLALASERRRVTVQVMPASASMSNLQDRIDSEIAPATLFVAFQLWHDAKGKPFSEGGAAILLRAKARPDPLRPASVGLKGVHIFRPMHSLSEHFKEDLFQLLDIQLVSKKAANFWLSAIGDDARGAVQVEAGNHPATGEASVRDLDAVLGTVGPASAWIALAIALEIGLKSEAPQLLAVNDDGKHTLMFAVMQSTKEVMN
ncbi:MULTISPECIES: hypothetical protein [unclassified Caballeronia]|uniref:hypothetical protein n=1 Tax=unclassified Caballeronia TaxID=2646786 RepID=UPI002027BA9D|nr:MULTISPECIES: hypothetical protein [unclassified Caballeronia]MDR5769104.1 hypothetical protein [Caballeronia sp. LZ028]